MPPDRELRRDQILEAALAAAAADRSGIVATQCGGDAELYAEVADLLIANHEMGERFLESVPEDDLHMGWTNERYRVERLIGRGGMSSVYRARDTKIDRRVALKLLNGVNEKAGDLRKSFLSEVRALGRVSHPNVVQVYDCGESDGLPFLVMELLEGEDLCKAIREDRCGSCENKIRISREIAIALSHIHSLGILHLDIKPSNVFLQADGCAKLMDFGISRPINRPLTQSNVFAGTLQYMAPEQLRGLPATPVSEVYSWGILLYEMLTKQSLFAVRSMSDLKDKQFDDELPIQPLLELSVPDGVIQLLKDATSRYPRQRPQTLAHVIQRIESSQTPTSSTIVTPRYENPMAVRAGLPPATVDGSGGQPSIAVLPFINLSTDIKQEYFCDGLTEEIINLLTRVPGLKVIARTSAFAFRGKEQDIRTIAKSLGVRTVLEGSVRREGDRIRVTAQLISAADGSHLFSERYDRQMKDIFAMQDEIGGAIVAALQMKLSLQRAAVRHFIPKVPAYEAVLKAWYYFNKLTPEALARGREYLAEAIQLDPRYARPHCELAFHFKGLAFMGVMPAHVAMPMAREAASRALEMDPSQPAEALSVLGLIAAVYEYDWKKAGKLFDLALVHGQLHSPALVYHCYYLVALGRTEDALRQIQLSLVGDPLNTFLRFHLAMWLVTAGRPADSAGECLRILELDENYGLAWITLSLARLQQGDLGKAVAAAEKATSVMPWSKGSQGYFAGLLTLIGEEERAAAALEKLGDRMAPGVPFAFVNYFMVLGEVDTTVDWVVHAIEQRSPMIVNLLRGPLAANLRLSACWPALANTMCLPDTP